MAKEFSKAFYNSAAWRHCRDAYISSVGGLCEDCYKRGIIRHGDEVHHIRPLTPGNIKDPEVSLAWKNLVYLCHDCHEKRHRLLDRGRRYSFDKNGNLVPNK